MLTVIKNYTFGDVRKAVKYLLDKAVVDDGVQSLAARIIAERPNKIAAIYDWVKGNVTYEPDPDYAELFVSPVRMVKNFTEGIHNSGDCDDMALLTTALLRTIGYKANLVLLDTKGEGFDHALTQVLSEVTGEEIMLDPSTDLVPLGWQERYYAKEIIE